MANYSSMRANYSDLLRQRELSKVGALRLVDFVQERSLRTLELSTAAELQTTVRSPTNCLALELIEYRYLLGGALGGTISLFDLEAASTAERQKSILQPLLQHTPTSTSRNCTTAVASVQWYPEDSGAFVAAGMSGNLSIFDTNYFTPVADFGFGQVMYSARIRTGGSESTLIAVALQDGTVRLCDPRTRDTSPVLKGHDRPVTCVDWCPSVGSGHLLASAGMDGAVRFWDVRRAGSISDAVVRSLDWRGDFSSSSKVDPRKLYTSLTSPHAQASGSQGGVVIRDAAQSHLPFRGDLAMGESSLHAGRAHDAGVMSMRFTSCGNFVVTSGNDQRMRMWDARSGKLVPTNFPEHIVPVAQLPYDIGIAELSYASADVLLVPASGHCAFAGSCFGVEGELRTAEGDILMVPAHSHDGQPIRLLKGHLERVTAVAYRKPQQQVISAARDGMIFLWYPPRGSRSSTAAAGRLSKESSRQHREYFGSSGARYDFQQVLSSVDPAAALQTSSAPSTQRVLRRPQLLPVRTSYDRTETPSALNTTRYTASHQSDGGTFSEESGDDWSEDEDLALVTAPAVPVKRIAKKRRTSAAAIVSAAGAELWSVGGSSAKSSTDIRPFDGLAPQPDPPTSTSRSFMPPIIQQYLRDANRDGPTAAGAPAFTDPSSLSSSGDSSVQWSAVDRVFQSSEGPERAATLHNPPPSSRSGAPAALAAPARSATAPNRGDNRTADQRYAQWLKQMRSKVGKKK